ncbi:MAG: hypothetical protein ABI435_01485 [Pseudolysinimonas sp.]
MTDPKLLASRATLEEFLAAYDPTMIPFKTYVGGATVLFGAVANPDPQARIDIANRLLDDGADPSIVTTDRNDRVNVLHVLWSRAHERDIPREGELVARLIDGGADINIRSPRFGPPLLEMIDHAVISLEYLYAMWDVVVAHSEPDMSIVLPLANGKTLAKRYNVKPMADRLHAYLVESGQLGLLAEEGEGL